MTRPTSMIGGAPAALAALACLVWGYAGVTAASAAPPAAVSSTAITVIHFPGGTALPLYVASAKGFFAATGVTVQLTPTFNSKQLMSGVLEKQYDIGNAAIDNLIAYQEMQAAPDLKVDRDLVAFMGTSSTNLDLVVQPTIKSYANLKGKTLAVDAPNTGFAFVLRKMLAINGLSEADYQFASVGGDGARLDALKADKAAGALLTTGFAKQAMAAGLTRLGTSLDALHHYQGTSFFTRRSWASAHRDELVKFIRALRQAHAWIFDPKNRDEAAQIFVDHSKGLTLDIAKSTIAQLTSPTGGLSPTGALDIEGIKVVLALRNQYGMPKRDLNDPGKYIDTSYYEAAGRH